MVCYFFRHGLNVVSLEFSLVVGSLVVQTESSDGFVRGVDAEGGITVADEEMVVDDDEALLLLLLFEPPIEFLLDGCLDPC